MQEILWLHSPFAYLSQVFLTLWTLANGEISHEKTISNYRVKSPFLGPRRVLDHVKQDHGIPQNQTEVPKGSEYYLTAMGDYPAKILAYDWPVGTSANMMLRV